MRLSRGLWRSTLHKHSTGLVGLPVNVNARQDAIALQHRLLDAVKVLPQTAGYRLSVEKMARERLDILNSSRDQYNMEAALGKQLEELCELTEDELSLVPEVAQAKPWEALEGAGKVEVVIKAY